jgi:hypothetical protein
MAASDKQIQTVAAYESVGVSHHVKTVCVESNVPLAAIPFIKYASTRYGSDTHLSYPRHADGPIYICTMPEPKKMFGVTSGHASVPLKKARFESKLAFLLA